MLQVNYKNSRNKKSDALKDKDIYDDAWGNFLNS